MRSIFSAWSERLKGFRVRRLDPRISCLSLSVVALTEPHHPVPLIQSSLTSCGLSLLELDLEPLAQDLVALQKHKRLSRTFGVSRALHLLDGSGCADPVLASRCSFPVSRRELGPVNPRSSRSRSPWIGQCQVPEQRSCGVPKSRLLYKAFITLALTTFPCLGNPRNHAWQIGRSLSKRIAVQLHPDWACVNQCSV